MLNWRSTKGTSAASANLTRPFVITALRTNENDAVHQGLMDDAIIVPKVGLEPTPCCQDRILSPARLPFRHFGYTLR